jgi:hypothetical protein
MAFAERGTRLAGFVAFRKALVGGGRWFESSAEHVGWVSSLFDRECRPSSSTIYLTSLKRIAVVNILGCSDLSRLIDRRYDEMIVGTAMRCG